MAAAAVSAVVAAGLAISTARPQGDELHVAGSEEGRPRARSQASVRAWTLLLSACQTHGATTSSEAQEETSLRVEHGGRAVVEAAKEKGTRVYKGSTVRRSCSSDRERTKENGGGLGEKQDPRRGA